LILTAIVVIADRAARSKRFALGVVTWMLRAVRWISTAVFALFAWYLAFAHHKVTFDELIRLPAFMVVIVAVVINYLAYCLQRWRAR
jgi:hypothetical protein